jgi:NADH-quinone oxidoreductase subunit C
MDFQGILDRLRAIEAPGLLGSDEPRPANPDDKEDKGRHGHSYVLVDPQRLTEFLIVVRDDPRLHFEVLMDLSATDPAKDDEEFWVNVQLLSVTQHHRLPIKCKLPKAAAALPTTVPAHRGAQWHERECAEMFGIEFIGHPDPRNILLPDDWTGSPLRKDYEFPTEYHGISCE